MEEGSVFGDGYTFNDERFYPNTYTLVLKLGLKRFILRIGIFAM
jgi:hypothetical protein